MARRGVVERGAARVSLRGAYLATWRGSARSVALRRVVVGCVLCCVVTRCVACDAGESRAVRVWRV